MSGWVMLAVGLAANAGVYLRCRWERKRDLRAGTRPWTAPEEPSYPPGHVIGGPTLPAGRQEAPCSGAAGPPAAEPARGQAAAPEHMPNPAMPQRMPWPVPARRFEVKLDPVPCGCLRVLRDGVLHRIDPCARHAAEIRRYREWVRGL